MNSTASKKPQIRQNNSTCNRLIWNAREYSRSNFNLCEYRDSVVLLFAERILTHVAGVEQAEIESNQAEYLNREGQVRARNESRAVKPSAVKRHFRIAVDVTLRRQTNCSRVTKMHSLHTAPGSSLDALHSNYTPQTHKLNQHRCAVAAGQKRAQLCSDGDYSTQLIRSR